jgi:AAA+ superfamily predicted ATPase
MATADQVNALISSHLDGDDERFMSIVMQIAAHASKNGHRSIASRIQAIVNHTRPLRPMRVELDGLLALHATPFKLEDMVLGTETRRAIDRVILENREKEKLAEHNMVPRRKLLLTGPPGCGKTMTASAVASALDMPLYKVVHANLFKSFMGETSANVAKVFEHVRANAGVYLLDEFDAMGSDRNWSDNSGPGGEIRRVVNALLTLLEGHDSSSLIIAATNHGDMLDNALFRRFDDVIRFPLPSVQQSLDVVSRVSRRVGLPIEGDLDKSLLDGLSHSEVESACVDAAKDSVLAGLAHTPSDLVESALRARGVARANAIPCGEGKRL